MNSLRDLEWPAPETKPHGSSEQSKNLPRHGPGGRFLKGPIPLGWLMRAAKQPGKSLHVAVALWYTCGLKRSREVPLSISSLIDFGVGRLAGYRGLAALERAGLVSVSRHSGRKPIVKLLGVAEDGR